MQEMPHDVVALFALAFAFGVKHGLDPDHLATIDGLARFNAGTKPWLAKWAGVLFSIGHGLVVTAVLAVIALMPAQVAVPGWLEGFGTTVSILTLLLLGVLNLHAAFRRRPGLSKPVGLKSWMRIQSGHPAIVLGIGALFALSFDTMSQAAFFSLAANHVNGEMYAFALGIVFTCGMITSDGLNGLIISRLLKQSSRRAAIASRVMSFVIGSASLIVAMLGMARLYFHALSEKLENYGFWPGLAVVVWICAGFVLALYATRTSQLDNQRA